MKVSADDCLLRYAMKQPGGLLCDTKDGGGNQVIKAGYGIPIASDTLVCRNIQYDLDVVVFGILPTGWLYTEDTLARNKKKQLA